MKRSSGVLLHISSLPSPYGIGTLGREAYRFADRLRAAGQSCWQVLPLGPTSYGDSPYQSFSTFAGNPYFIDLEELAEEGLLRRGELEAVDWGEDPRQVDYGKLYENRFRILRRCYERGWERSREAVEAFAREKPWLEDYALFMALKGRLGMKSWTEWEDEDVRLRRRDALERCRRALGEETELVVDLASREYSRAVLPHLPQGVRVLTCTFAQRAGDKLAERGTLCKMARGQMVRWMAERSVTRPEELRDFSQLGYRYDPESSGEEHYVFIKEDDSYVGSGHEGP